MRLPFSRSGKPASAPDALDPRCANCGHPLSVGQDWCLDCGTAVRGRLGRGPGLGSSIGVVGLTLLLVLGAVAAAYAALSSDSNQAVKTPPAAVAGVPSTPDVGTTAPAGSTGTTGAVTTTPITPTTSTPLPTLPKIPGVTPVPGVRAGTTAPTATTTPQTQIKPAVTPTVTTTPATTPTVTTKPQTTPTVTTPTATTPTATTPTATTPTATTPTTTTPESSHEILLDTDAASTYNPYTLPASSFGDPADAIDGALNTAWTYQLAPSAAGSTLVGLTIDLKTPQAARAIKITTLSPGMTVEFYGADGASPPASITAPGWVHLANRRAIKVSTTVVLKTAGASFRYLLVWITHAPAGVTAGSVGISELSVYN
jgi:outer membrane biosynthesis protein TonB